MRWVIAIVLIGSTAGCRKPPSPPSQKPSAAPVVAVNTKEPRFQSELYRKFADGGTGTHRSTRYDRAEPFTAVEQATVTHRTGAVVLKYDVAFIAHRDGQDIYRFTYTIEKEGGSESKSGELAYVGQRVVVVEDNHGIMVLQPPTGED